MIGLMLLTAIAVCFVSILWLSNTLGNLVKNTALRRVSKVIIFLILLASPFVDEVIGKYQFESLCKANGIESADVSKAVGKKVKVEYGELIDLKGKIMPMKVQNIQFFDTENGERLINYKNYQADGGWLMRYTPLNMGSKHPMLFSGACYVDYVKRDAIFSKNNITLIH